MKHYGSHPKGSAVKGAKLEEGQVLSIRAAYKSGEKTKSIAERYGISPNHVLRIVHGYCWQWIGGECDGRCIDAVENAPTVIPASDKDINVLGKEEGET